MTTLTIVLPIFIVVFFGYLAKRFNIVKPEWIHVLNNFVFYVSLPAIILVSFWQVNWLESSVWKSVGLNMLALALFSAVVLGGLALTKLSKKLKAAIYLTSVFGNTIYMGLPIAGGIAGVRLYPHVIAAATGHMVFGSIFGIVVTDIYVSRPKSLKQYLLSYSKNPLIISLFVGIIFSILQLNHPDFNIIKKPIAMVGATASPIALFVLGSFLCGKFVKKHFNLSLLSVALKLVIFPLCMFGIFTLLKVQDITRDISLILAAMPAAVTCFIIAEQYELEESLVANSIVMSTVLSLVAIYLILVFVGRP